MIEVTVVVHAMMSPARAADTTECSSSYPLHSFVYSWPPGIYSTIVAMMKQSSSHAVSAASAVLVLTMVVVVLGTTTIGGTEAALEVVANTSTFEAVTSGSGYSGTGVVSISLDKHESVTQITAASLSIVSSGVNATTVSSIIVRVHRDTCVYHSGDAWSNDPTSSSVSANRLQLSLTSSPGGTFAGSLDPVREFAVDSHALSIRIYDDNEVAILCGDLQHFGSLLPPVPEVSNTNIYSDGWMLFYKVNAGMMISFFLWHAWYHFDKLLSTRKSMYVFSMVSCLLSALYALLVAQITEGANPFCTGYVQFVTFTYNMVNVCLYVFLYMKATLVCEVTNFQKLLVALVWIFTLIIGVWVTVSAYSYEDETGFCVLTWSLMPLQLLPIADGAQSVILLYFFMKPILENANTIKDDKRLKVLAKRNLAHCTAAIISTTTYLLLVAWVPIGNHWMWFVLIDLGINANAMTATTRTVKGDKNANGASNVDPGRAGFSKPLVASSIKPSSARTGVNKYAVRPDDDDANSSNPETSAKPESWFQPQN